MVEERNGTNRTKGGIHIADGKPTTSQIAEASKAGTPKGQGGLKQYEIVAFHDVEILIPKRVLLNAIEITHEFTHDPAVEKLAGEMGIALRRFR